MKERRARAEFYIIASVIAAWFGVIVLAYILG